MKSFSLFYKDTGGNEGDKCNYQTRLDSYGCGCQHDCNYCYAKSLLNFRNLWNAQKPVVASTKQVRNAINDIKKKKIQIVRLGGMTDPFQPMELQYRTTYQIIKMLNKHKIGYLIVTKSHLVANDEYLEIYDKDLARKLLQDDFIVFDEFTSVVDRRVAETMCIATNKTIHKLNKQIVVISCHYDILNWLQPDWVFDTNNMKSFFIMSHESKNNIQSNNATLTSGKSLGNIII